MSVAQRAGALSSGPGPDPAAPALRRVAVDARDLEEAFETNEAGDAWYLHLGSGSLVRKRAGGRPVLDPELLLVPALDPRVQFQWIEEFIGSLADPELVFELRARVHGARAFRRFKDALREREHERQAWFVFRREKRRRVVEQWLALNGIEPSGHLPAALQVALAPAGEPPPSCRTRERFLRSLEDLGERDLAIVLASGEFLAERRRQMAAAAAPADLEGEGEISGP